MVYSLHVRVNQLDGTFWGVMFDVQNCHGLMFVLRTVGARYFNQMHCGPKMFLHQPSKSAVPHLKINIFEQLKMLIFKGVLDILMKRVLEHFWDTKTSNVL